MPDKIVFVLPALPKYRHDFLVLLYEELKKTNHELVIVTGINNWNKVIVEIEEDLPVKVIRCKTAGFKLLNVNVNWQKKFVRSVFAEKPDKVVLMYHTGKLNHSILLLLCLLRGLPFVFWGSGYRRVDLKGMTLKIKHSIKHFFEKRSRGYITYSQYFADILIDKGFDKDKVIVAQNTINVEKILERQELSVKHRNKIFSFLFVGALIPLKRLDFSFLACTELLSQGYSFRFDIVGGGVILDDLRSLIDTHGLQEHVFLHGAQFGEDVVPFFSKADVFLLPGTGGLAINEAMAYGLPVISAPGDGTAYDLIENGENGFILENGYELKDLKEAMKYFLDLNTEDLLDMGRKSTEKVESMASLRNMVDKFAQGMKTLG